jgi:hypothetical protein
MPEWAETKNCFRCGKPIEGSRNWVPGDAEWHTECMSRLQDQIDENYHEMMNELSSSKDPE